MSNMTLNDVLAHCAENYATAELTVTPNEDGSWTARLVGNTMMHGCEGSVATGEHVHMALALLVEAYCNEEGIL